MSFLLAKTLMMPLARLLSFLEWSLRYFRSFAAFRPYREKPSASQRIYLVRSQEAVILVVFMTLASNVVALTRHPFMWIGHGSQNLLIGLLGGMATVTAAVQLALSASQQKAVEHRARDWVWAASATLLAILVRIAYPEGALVGLWVFLAEIFGGTGAFPKSRLMFVGSVFIRLGLAGFLIAYVLLRKPLGLGVHSTQCCTISLKTARLFVLIAR